MEPQPGVADPQDTLEMLWDALEEGLDLEDLSPTERTQLTAQAALQPFSYDVHVRLGMELMALRRQDANMRLDAEQFGEQLRRRAYVRDMLKRVAKEDNWVQYPASDLERINRALKRNVSTVIHEGREVEDDDDSGAGHGRARDTGPSSVYAKWLERRQRGPTRRAAFGTSVGREELQPVPKVKHQQRAEDPETPVNGRRRTSMQGTQRLDVSGGLSATTFGVAPRLMGPISSGSSRVTRSVGGGQSRRSLDVSRAGDLRRRVSYEPGGAHSHGSEAGGGGADGGDGHGDGGDNGDGDDDGEGGGDCDGDGEYDDSDNHGDAQHGRSGGGASSRGRASTSSGKVLGFVEGEGFAVRFSAVEYDEEVNDGDGRLDIVDAAEILGLGGVGGGRNHTSRRGNPFASSQTGLTAGGFHFDGSSGSEEPVSERLDWRAALRMNREAKATTVEAAEATTMGPIEELRRSIRRARSSKGPTPSEGLLADGLLEAELPPEAPLPEVTAPLGVLEAAVQAVEELGNDHLPALIHAAASAAPAAPGSPTAAAPAAAAAWLATAAQRLEEAREEYVTAHTAKLESISSLSDLNRQIQLLREWCAGLEHRRLTAAAATLAAQRDRLAAAAAGAGAPELVRLLDNCTVTVDELGAMAGAVTAAAEEALARLAEREHRRAALRLIEDECVRLAEEMAEREETDRLALLMRAEAEAEERMAEAKDEEEAKQYALTAAMLMGQEEWVLEKEARWTALKVAERDQRRLASLRVAEEGKSRAAEQAGRQYDKGLLQELKELEEAARREVEMRRARLEEAISELAQFEEMIRQQHAREEAAAAAAAASTPAPADPGQSAAGAESAPQQPSMDDKGPDCVPSAADALELERLPTPPAPPGAPAVDAADADPRAQLRAAVEALQACSSMATAVASTMPVAGLVSDSIEEEGPEADEGGEDGDEDHAALAQHSRAAQARLAAARTALEAVRALTATHQATLEGVAPGLPASGAGGLRLDAATFEAARAVVLQEEQRIATLVSSCSMTRLGRRLLRGVLDACAGLAALIAEVTEAPPSPPRPASSSSQLQAAAVRLASSAEPEPAAEMEAAAVAGEAQMPAETVGEGPSGWLDESAASPGPAPELSPAESAAREDGSKLLASRTAAEAEEPPAPPPQDSPPSLLPPPPSKSPLLQPPAPQPPQPPQLTPVPPSPLPPQQPQQEQPQKPPPQQPQPPQHPAHASAVPLPPPQPPHLLHPTPAQTQPPTSPGAGATLAPVRGRPAPPANAPPATVLLSLNLPGSGARPGAGSPGLEPWRRAEPLSPAMPLHGTQLPVLQQPPPSVVYPAHALTHTQANGAQHASHVAHPPTCFSPSLPPAVPHLLVGAALPGAALTAGGAGRHGAQHAPHALHAQSNKQQHINQNSHLSQHAQHGDQQHGQHGQNLKPQHHPGRVAPYAPVVAAAPSSHGAAAISGGHAAPSPGGGSGGGGGSGLHGPFSPLLQLPAVPQPQLVPVAGASFDAFGAASRRPVAVPVRPGPTGDFLPPIMGHAMAGTPTVSPSGSSTSQSGLPPQALPWAAAAAQPVPPYVTDPDASGAAGSGRSSSSSVATAGEPSPPGANASRSLLPPAAHPQLPAAMSPRASPQAQQSQAEPSPRFQALQQHQPTTPQPQEPQHPQEHGPAAGSPSALDLQHAQKAPLALEASAVYGGISEHQPPPVRTTAAVAASVPLLQPAVSASPVRQSWPQTAPTPAASLPPSVPYAHDAPAAAPRRQAPGAGSIADSCSTGGDSGSSLGAAARGAQPQQARAVLTLGDMSYTQWVSAHQQDPSPKTLEAARQVDAVLSRLPPELHSVLLNAAELLTVDGGGGQDVVQLQPLIAGMTAVCGGGDAAYAEGSAILPYLLQGLPPVVSKYISTQLQRIYSTAPAGGGSGGKNGAAAAAADGAIGLAADQSVSVLELLSQLLPDLAQGVAQVRNRMLGGSGGGAAAAAGPWSAGSLSPLSCFGHMQGSPLRSSRKARSLIDGDTSSAFVHPLPPRLKHQTLSLSTQPVNGSARSGVHGRRGKLGGGAHRGSGKGGGSAPAGDRQLDLFGMDGWMVRGVNLQPTSKVAMTVNGEGGAGVGGGRLAPSPQRETFLPPLGNKVAPVRH